MILNTITNGSISGASTTPIKGKLLGAVSITADGTNNATVICRTTDASGQIIFHMVTKSPVFIAAPISNNGSDVLYYSISGTGASAQLYEWIE